MESTREGPLEISTTWHPCSKVWGATHPKIAFPRRARRLPATPSLVGWGPPRQPCQELGPLQRPTGPNLEPPLHRWCQWRAEHLRGAATRPPALRGVSRRGCRAYPSMSRMNVLVRTRAPASRHTLAATDSRANGTLARGPH